MLLLIEFIFYRLIIYFRLNNGKSGFALLKFDGLGDLVIMLNALNRFEVTDRFRPLILVTKFEFVDVAKNYSTFDQVIGVEENIFRKNMKYRHSIYKKIRKINPKSIINPVFSNIVTSFSDLIVAATAPPCRIIGPTYISKSIFGKIIKKFKQTVYNNFISFHESSTHELNHNINFFSAIGMQHTLCNEKFIQTPKNQVKVNEGISKFVVISPGSNNPIKNWEIQKFIDLAIELNRLGYTVKFIGTKSDLSELKLPFGLKEKVEIYSNLSNLTDLFYLINQSALVISNDSSVSHIAQFLNLPYIVISWGVFKGRFFPYPNFSDTSKVIFSSECLNCKESCKEVRINAKCLKSISVNQVLTEVKILLNKP